MITFEHRLQKIRLQITQILFASTLQVFSLHFIIHGTPGDTMG